MLEFTEHLLPESASVREALIKINALGQDLVLFIHDQDDRLVGTLTDGDIRRALIVGHGLNEPVQRIMHRSFRYLDAEGYSIDELRELRKQAIDLVPILDRNRHIQRLVNLRTRRSLLPVQAVIMAGGDGRRLRPLTEKTPKPLLPIGGKPILQYNVEHLVSYGVDDITLSIRYHGDQIIAAFGDGSRFGCRLSYLHEKLPLGTIGALSLIEEFKSEVLLVMNADVLTNIDFEDFYREFVTSGSAFAVATVPYKVNVPYAVLETMNGNIVSFQEKPSYTYYSNAGIYLIGRDVLRHIPSGQRYDATELMETLIARGERPLSYPLRDYWLDIGRPEDLAKAEDDVRHIRF